MHLIADGEFLADSLVVTVDRLHDQEDHRHGDHDDPGALHELSRKDQDEDEAGERGAECIDCAGPEHFAAELW